MLEQFSLARYEEAISRGLCKGVGEQSGQMCIEAAVCYALGLPHGDDPKCVAIAVRAFKIAINDSNWSSESARAAGLRDLGIAQLGSLGVVNGFAKIVSEHTIRRLIPMLFREVFPNDEKLLGVADRCEREGTANAASNAAVYAAACHANAANAANATNAAYYASNAAYYASYAAYYASYASYYATYDAANASNVAYAANAASYAAYAAYAAANDDYLLLSAKIALEALRDLGSPGISLLEKGVF